VKNAPKKLLFELPAADEIDDLAITTPRFAVRKFEFDLTDTKADLRYPPCKAQVVLVVKGKNGVALAKHGKDGWILPSGRIGAAEEIPTAAKRLAREEFGLPVMSIELAGIYDVIWHYSDLTVKRLHFVYSGMMGDEPEQAARNKVGFHQKPEEIVTDEISKAALTDCKEK